MSIIEAVWGEAIKQNRLGHAYLLIGQSLDSVIVPFLTSLYCENACGDCAQCHKVAKLQHPDITIVERDGKRIKIDQIRALQRDARYPPLEATRKVYILKDVEGLSIEAANGLLKILESPPAYLLFLLTAESPKVLPTILSRCQVVRFNPTEISEQAKLLSDRGLKKNEIAAALNHTRGVSHRFGDVLATLESGSLLESQQAIQEELAGKPPLELVEFLTDADGIIEAREIALRLIQSTIHLKPYDLLDLAQALSKLESDKIEFYLEESLRWYRDLLIIKSRSPESHIFNQDQTATLRDHAFAMTRTEISKAVEKLERGRAMTQGNANMQLYFESLVFTLAGLG